jgi:hypothetical protein
MKKYNYICLKDKFNAKGYWAPTCPKCGEAMICIGDRWRIGRKGNFSKIEGRAKKAKLGINTYIR